MKKISLNLNVGIVFPLLDKLDIFILTVKCEYCSDNHHHKNLSIMSGFLKMN